jgi:alpha-D-ribose 1-methylphosphonate 5-triphosphate synthase subunit PhnH
MIAGLPLDTRLVGAGFPDPVFDAQRVFRHLLRAMASPGTIVDLEPLPAPVPPLNDATNALLLGLADGATPLWLDPDAPAAATHIRFHCGSPIVLAPGQATFAILTQPLAPLPALDSFALGSEQMPEQSTTLIVQVTGLGSDGDRWLTGPGIRDGARLRVDGVDERFWALMTANHALFPRGIDVVLTTGPRLTALPRTTLWQRL